jgi:hypothetical protein
MKKYALRVLMTYVDLPGISKLSNANPEALRAIFTAHGSGNASIEIHCSYAS